MKKKIFQKAMKIILIIFTMIGLINNDICFAHAASYQVTYTEVDNWKIKGGHYNGDLSGIIKADNEITWCIENHKNLIDGENKTISPSDVGLSDKDMQILSLIAYYGYRVSPTIDHYMLTQNAVWAYTNQIQKPSQDLRAYNIAIRGPYSSEDNIHQWIDDLMKKVDAFYQLPSFAGETFDIKANQTMTLSDKNGVLNDLIIDKQSNGLTVEKNGNTLKIIASDSISTGQIILKRSLSDEQLKTNFVVRSGTNGQAHSKLTGTTPYQTSVDFRVINKGNLKIVKKDDQGNVVPHTQFKISYHEDMSNPIGIYTTSQEGIVEISDLKVGNIYIQEVKVPEHLKIDQTIYSVVIKPGELSYFTATNQWKKGYLRITKKDADSGKIVKLKGTIFEIYNVHHQKVEQIVTDETGIAISHALNYGTYYVKEIKAPDGYVITAEVSEETAIIDNDKIYDITFYNSRVQGRILLSKEDSVLKKNILYHNVTLKGAIYGVFAKEDILDPADHSVIFSSGDKIGEMVTDEQGNASIDHLYLGTYVIQEMKPSQGYNIDNTKHEVSLIYDNQNQDVVMKKVTSYERVISQPFSIIKIASQGTGEAELLQGAEFTVKSQDDIEKYGSWEKAPIAFNAEGKTTQTLVTDEKGYAQSDRLPIGTYVVRETKTPLNKYPVPDFTVTITKDSLEPLPYRVFNDETFQAALAIVKKDTETNKIVRMKGAKFRIKNLDTSSYVGYWQWNPIPHYVTSWETDDSGYVLLEEPLPSGHYQLEEIKGPQGYLLNQTAISFEIGMNTAYEILPDGKTPLVTVSMSDRPVKGMITVEKKGEVLVDYKSGQFIYEKRGLSDAYYHIIAYENIMDPSGDGTVLYSQGTLVEELKTDQYGKAASSKLPLGKYEVLEVKAPHGYSLSHERKLVELKYQDDLEELVYQSISYLNDRQHFQVNVKKFDSQTKLSLEGAEFGLYVKNDVMNVDGKVIVFKDSQVAKAISNDKGNALFSIDLPYDCEFYVKEQKAPLGYVLTSQKEDLNTNYHDQNQKNIYIEKVFGNAPTLVEISKQDITSGKEIAGNHLMVIDQAGHIIDEWISEAGKSHFLYCLHVGETYTLVEKNAALGYVKAKDISFMIQNTEDIQKVEMKNDYTHLQFQKVNEKGEALAGATLAIVPVDDHGKIQKEKVIKRWITKEDDLDTQAVDESLYQIDYLPIGQYALLELSAPYGYEKALPMLFEVKETEEIQRIVLKNSLILTQLDVYKIDSQTKQMIICDDVEMTLYSDKECTQVVAVVSGKGKVAFHDLRYGTYYLKETKAPQGYQLSDEVREIVVNDLLEEKNHIHAIYFENKAYPVVKTSDVYCSSAIYMGLFLISAVVLVSRKKLM